MALHSKEHDKLMRDIYSTLHMIEVAPEQNLAYEREILSLLEILTVNARNEFSETNTFLKVEPDESAARQAKDNVCIFSHSDYEQICMPRLLHKTNITFKKAQIMNRYLAGMLVPAMDKHYKSNPYQKNGKKKAVCFFHYYKGKVTCDADNMERKTVIDIISPYYLFDDAGNYMSLYIDSKKGNYAHTEIFVMDKDKFPKFIKNTITEGR